ncbi:pantothenate kinase [Schaalia meyeri]|nr:pantothenate kinase [Schaalia meyeri]
MTITERPSIIPATASSAQSHSGTTRTSPSPYTRFDRAEWDRLADRTALPLTQEDINRIASLGDPIDMSEVDAIYRPLSALLQLYIDGRRRTAAERHSFLGEPKACSTPFVIGIAGSVAVGKSTVARLLQLLLSRWDSTPRVDLVTTDGFLFPNRVLQERSLIARKGFPESYDRLALIWFLASVKAGVPHAKAPVYSHVTYDVVPGAYVDVDRPDILIVEGLNVLQPPRLAPGSVSVAVSDYFDFSIYVDADEKHIEQWYVDRFLKLRATAFSREDSYFRTYASLTDAEAASTARMVWNAINLPNLRDNIRPTRERATLVFTKGADHRVESLAIRKD